eukprot:PhF_6_TR17058/c0_g3_i3/m.26054
MYTIIVTLLVYICCFVNPNHNPSAAYLQFSNSSSSFIQNGSVPLTPATALTIPHRTILPPILLEVYNVLGGMLCAADTIVCTARMNANSELLSGHVESAKNGIVNFSSLQVLGGCGSTSQVLSFRCWGGVEPCDFDSPATFPSVSVYVNVVPIPYYRLVVVPWMTSVPQSNT